MAENGRFSDSEKDWAGLMFYSLIPLALASVIAFNHYNDSNGGKVQDKPEAPKEISTSEFSKAYQKQNLREVDVKIKEAGPYDKHRYFVGYDSSSDKEKVRISEINDKQKTMNLYDIVKDKSDFKDEVQSNSKTKYPDSTLAGMVAGMASRIIRHFDSTFSQSQGPEKHDSTSIYDSLRRTDSIEDRFYRPEE